MSYGMQYAGGRPIPGGSGTRPIPGGFGSASGGLADLGGGTSNARALERVIRPFEHERVLALRARRKAREEDQSDDSLIRWGRPSEHGSATQSAEDDRRGFSIAKSNPTQDPQDPNDLPRVYSEISRETETVRVRNPENAEQYVDVARIKSILFRGPDGRSVRFDLTPPAGEVV